MLWAWAHTSIFVWAWAQTPIMEGLGLGPDGVWAFILYCVIFTLFTVNESTEVGLPHGQQRVGGDVGGEETAQQWFVVSLLNQLGK